jgi:hypothetical protein
LVEARFRQRYANELPVCDDVYVGIVVLLVTRRRKGTARVSRRFKRSRTSTAGSGALSVQSSTIVGLDDFRVEREDAGALVFVQGVTEERGRVHGLTSPDHVPRRAIVRVVGAAVPPHDDHRSSDRGDHVVRDARAPA